MNKEKYIKLYVSFLKIFLSSYGKGRAARPVVRTVSYHGSLKKEGGEGPGLFALPGQNFSRAGTENPGLCREAILRKQGEKGQKTGGGGDRFPTKPIKNHFYG